VKQLLHKSEVARIVHWIIVICVPAWRWLG